MISAEAVGGLATRILVSLCLRQLCPSGTHRTVGDNQATRSFQGVEKRRLQKRRSLWPTHSGDPLGEGYEKPISMWELL